VLFKIHGFVAQDDVSEAALFCRLCSHRLYLLCYDLKAYKMIQKESHFRRLLRRII